MPGPRERFNAHFITRLLNALLPSHDARIKGQTHLEFEATLPENNDLRSESDDPDRPAARG